MNRFDFDDWSRLYRLDPDAFEARRRAILAIELSRVAPALAAPVRCALREFEADVAGLEDAARLEASMKRMAASVDALSASMTTLARATGNAARSRSH